MLENQATLLHPLMIGCYETFLTPKFFCIVTEFAEGGDLDSFLKSQPGERLTEASARSVFQQTIIALEYIQKRVCFIFNTLFLLLFHFPVAHHFAAHFIFPLFSPSIFLFTGDFNWQLQPEESIFRFHAFSGPRS